MYSAKVQHPSLAADDPRRTLRAGALHPRMDPAIAVMHSLPRCLRRVAVAPAVVLALVAVAAPCQQPEPHAPRRPGDPSEVTLRALLDEIQLRRTRITELHSNARAESDPQQQSALLDEARQAQ